jgi:hypothetical protein
VVSLTTIEETTRQLHDDLNRPNGGIVAFNCGYARSLGFDARQEMDELFPENKAHAHVYYDAGKSSRKKNARRLASQCRIVVEPQF